MSLSNFKPELRTHGFVQALKRDSELRARFEADPGAVAEGYGLTPQEVTAIRERDFRALFDLGMHPFLLGQLARLLFGTAEGGAASAAASALVASLRGDATD